VAGGENLGAAVEHDFARRAFDNAGTRLVLSFLAWVARPRPTRTRGAPGRAPTQAAEAKLEYVFLEATTGPARCFLCVCVVFVES